MKIIICGCGKIGKSILESLVREGHEITVIDTEPSVISSVTEIYDVMGICASCTSCDALSRASVQSAGLFVAATSSDEVNMLACFLAGRMGAEHTVARIGNKENNIDNLDFIKRELGLSMIINPDLLTAQTIYNILKFPSAVKSETFTRRRFEMAELTVKSDSILNGAVLYYLRSRLNIPFLVCCVLRENKAYIPKGDFTLQAGDRIGLLAAPDDMHKVLKYIGILQKRAKDVMVLGGSRIAVYLAKELTRSGNNVTIIEKNQSRCNELCAALPQAVNIICGDGTRHALLSEEGLDRTDAFVSLTGMDEENILSSYCALDRKVPKIITKANQDGFGDISEKLGLDCIVSPRRITADIVTQYARALQNSQGSKIETLYRLMNGAVEALEFAVSPDFSRLNTPIKDLNIKPGILLAGIIRGSKTIIPAGNDVILPGDNVIVIAANQKLCDLSEIML
ncbi:MAG: Trk system potassium transporter TrkA [Bacillota bacterium]|nr:Trk system potassium transporter TrkA [Bacillota bacterium]